MRRGSLFLPCLVLTGACAATVEGGPRFVTSAALTGDYAVPVASLDQTRFAGVIRQQYDFSCGSAALATLLRYSYDYDVGEAKAFRGMWAEGDREQIRRVGFSLLDMKRWLASRGLQADGFQVTLDQVAETRVPGIALISVNNYRHFVVVKGIRGDEVLVGDPSLGLTVMTRAQFSQAWNGIYFVLTGEQERGRKQFTGDRFWASYNRAPVGANLADPVSQQALMLTAPFIGDIS